MENFNLDNTQDISGGKGGWGVEISGGAIIEINISIFSSGNKDTDVKSIENLFNSEWNRKVATIGLEIPKPSVAEWSGYISGAKVGKNINFKAIYNQLNTPFPWNFSCD